MSNGVKEAADEEGASGAGALEQCYVLVHGHTQGLTLYQEVRAAGVDARIAPAPREAKSACGMALLVPCDQVSAALAAGDASGVGYDRVMRVRRRFDPHRDRFC